MQPYRFKSIGLFSSFEVHKVIFSHIMHVIINQKGKSGGTFFEAFTAFTAFTALTVAF
jgi:hypothetical protein